MTSGSPSPSSSSSMTMVLETAARRTLLCTARTSAELSFPFSPSPSIEGASSPPPSIPTRSLGSRSFETSAAFRFTNLKFVKGNSALCISLCLGLFVMRFPYHGLPAPALNCFAHCDLRLFVSERMLLSQARNMSPTWAGCLRGGILLGVSLASSTERIHQIILSLPQLDTQHSQHPAHPPRALPAAPRTPRARGTLTCRRARGTLGSGSGGCGSGSASSPAAPRWSAATSCASAASAPSLRARTCARLSQTLGPS